MTRTTLRESLTLAALVVLGVVALFGAAMVSG